MKNGFVLHPITHKCLFLPLITSSKAKIPEIRLFFKFLNAKDAKQAKKTRRFFYSEVFTHDKSFDTIFDPSLLLFIKLIIDA